MSKKSKKKSVNRKAGSLSRPVQAAFLCGLVMVLFHLWGRVRIDTELRAKNKYEQEMKQLAVVRSNLEIEINRMRSFSNIVNQVTRQGLSPVAPANKHKLVVDLDDYKCFRNEGIRPARRMNYAGFRLRY